MSVRQALSNVREPMTGYGDDSRALAWFARVPEDASAPDLLREVIGQACALRDIIAEHSQTPGLPLPTTLTSRALTIVSILDRIRERMDLPDGFGFSG